MEALAILEDMLIRPVIDRLIMLAVAHGKRSYADILEVTTPYVLEWFKTHGVVHPALRESSSAEVIRTRMQHLRNKKRLRMLDSAFMETAVWQLDPSEAYLGTV
jgi:hypothetical protein